MLVFIFSGFSSAYAMKLYYDGKWHNYTEPPIFLKVEGKDINASMPPITFGEFSLVPAREVFEALGAEVIWDGDSQTVKILYEGNNILLTIDKSTAKVNGEDKSLVLAPKIINDKTMVPTRFVSEQLGFNIEWAGSESTIYISRKPQNISVTDIKFIANPNGITQVSYNGTKTVQVQINANSQIEDYSTMTLQSPYRLVIDVKNSVLNVSKYNIPVSRDGISQIRTSQYSVEPNITRIVIDFEKLLKYNLYLSSDKRQITVDIAVPVTQNTGGNTIVIDPGHGGNDPGAVYSGISEKDLNLKICMELKNLLQQEGIKVYMTRENDSFVDLYARSDLANSLNADLLLSVHNNAMEDDSFDGTMTLYYPNDDAPGFTNRSLAQIIQNQIVSDLGTTNRGIIQRPKLAVLRTSQVPSALVEVAFMTNYNDMTKLKNDNFIRNAAMSLKDGILKALNEKNKY